MVREFPSVLFERYADDIVVHCTSQRQAESALAAIATRMEEVASGSTRRRRVSSIARTERTGEKHEHTELTFLGFTFRQRKAQNSVTTRFFLGVPARDEHQGLNAKGTELRRMRIHRHINPTLDDLARWLNPMVRGWMQYYGRFHRTAMQPLLRRVSTYLMRWAWNKYRRLRTHKHFQRWWHGLLERAPGLFAHRRWVRAY
jgi:RNA-directed DNA polymerase